MKAILTIMVSLFAVCSVYAEDSAVFSDQDLSKYSYSNDEKIRDSYERIQQRDKSVSEQAKQEKKKDILYEMQIILGEDTRTKSKCSRLHDLIIKYKGLIEGDKSEQAEFASVKMSYNDLCSKRH